MARTRTCPLCGHTEVVSRRPLRTVEHPRYYSGSTFWQVIRVRPMPSGRVFAILEGENGTWIQVERDGDRWRLPSVD